MNLRSIAALTFFLLTLIGNTEETISSPSEGIITAPGLDDIEHTGLLKEIYRRLDPTEDGWASEALSDRASEQLKKLSKKLEKPSSLTADSLAPYTAKDFSSPSLFPAELTEVFRDENLTVRRGEVTSSSNQQSLLQTWQDWLKSLGLSSADAEPHLKLKLYRIQQENEQTATSKVLCTLTAHKDDQRIQINTDWTCTWALNENAPPRLKSLSVDSYEEVTTTSTTPLFGDITVSVLGETTAYREQFLRSSDYWRARLPRDFGLDAAANHGLALGDINGDGLEDLYLCQQGGLPNRLFLQNPDGTLRDFTKESNTGWLEYCSSALIVDLDNDGDRDLVVAQEFRLLFLDNLDGAGNFELALGISTKGQNFSLAAADIDEDGFLDIYSCGYNPQSNSSQALEVAEPLPYHDANNGGPSTLWRNMGNWDFQDITEQVGLDVNNRRFSFAASFEDFDNDGDLDLYVANDYGRNCLYRNEGKGRKFTDIAAELNVEDASSGMSTAWADINRDGWLDLYISNMFSSAGNRITYQPQFKTDVAEDVRAQYQHMARGNTLFQADGKGGFSDVSLDLGVNVGRWAWGSTFADWNNDGWDDILVANGFISTEDTGDL